jgi:hypothetical protein
MGRHQRTKHKGRHTEDQDDWHSDGPAHKYGGGDGKHGWCEPKMEAPLCKKPDKGKDPVFVADDDDSLTLMLGGTATAAGENTFADGSITGEVVDKGAYTVAVGTCMFTAAAEAGADGSAFASATSFANAEGADFIFSFSTTVTGVDCDPATESQTAKSFIIAIDFHDWDFARGPVQVDLSLDFEKFRLIDDITDLNYADFTSQLTAQGENTFAEVDFSVLTVEDTLSDVAALALLGVA